MSGLTDVARSVSVKPSIVAEIFEEILARTKKGEHVRIKGFGTFRSQMYPGRTLTSPTVNNGKPVKFDDSMMLKFRQSQIAKQRLNAEAPKAKQPAKASKASKKKASKAKGK